jgi:hypothetical protein
MATYIFQSYLELELFINLGKSETPVLGTIHKKI